MAVIVVADDDADIADLVAYGLERAGHTVYAALDGRRALSLVLTYRPCLVVLDNGMPGLSGMEVTAALREDGSTADAQVIMITGMPLADPDDLVDRLVTKPVAPRQVRALINEALSVANRRHRSCGQPGDSV
jgi:two-component system phosphate regulon response regulator PhoB